MSFFPNDARRADKRSIKPESYHKLGEVTLQMDENFVLTDDSDPDTPPQVYTAEELFAIRDRLIGEFKPYNTAVTVKNEKIISIYRKFMP